MNHNKQRALKKNLKILDTIFRRKNKLGFISYIKIYNFKLIKRF